MIKKIDGCKNDSEKLSTTKVGERISSEFSMSTIQIFDGIENKHGVNKDDDWMKKFYKFLREHLMKIIIYEKKKRILFTNKHQESYEKAQNCYVCKSSLKMNKLIIKKYRTVKDHCHYTGKYRGAVHSIICNVKYIFTMDQTIIIILS